MATLSRQIATVLNLQTPPRPGYTLIEFRVEQWAGDHLFVARKYRPDHATSLEYSEGFRIGPRGGVETIYESRA